MFFHFDTETAHIECTVHPGRLKDTCTYVLRTIYWITILHVKINISNTHAFWEGAEALNHTYEMFLKTIPSFAAII